jgi:hypothetical protein
MEHHRLSMGNMELLRQDPHQDNMERRRPVNMELPLLASTERRRQDSTEHHQLINRSMELPLDHPQCHLRDTTYDNAPRLT